MVGLSLAVSAAAIAKDDKKKDDRKECKRSQDCALDAFKSGEIRPLAEVLEVARGKVPGEVVKIKLDMEDGAWVYEVKILTPAGRRRELEINARTLAIIKID